MIWRRDEVSAVASTLSRSAMIISGAVVLAIVSGCSLAPPPEMPATVVEMPVEFDAAADRAPADAEHDAFEWWRSFDDPTLDRLVETALTANLDLREAVGRLEELRHRYRIAGAPLLPSITLNADVSNSNSPGNTGLGGAFGGDGAGTDSTAAPGLMFPDRFDFTTYSASIGFAYELDFWGRLRSESSASIYDFLASRSDLETVRLAVIGSTISTYLEVVAARRQLALAAENLDLLRERSELTDDRYRSGLVNSFELYSIRQQYRTAQSELPGNRTQVEDAEGRLAVILGRYAGTLDGVLGSDLAPAVDTAPIAAGLPASLLEERPDVLAAFERLEAARMRVGARRAELLPTISLNGSVGFQASEPSNLFRADQWFSNLIGGIFAPLFQGGRLRANVGVAEAQYDQLISAYVRTVLQAYSEVRTSLFRLDNERERYARVTDQVDEAQASLDYQLRRYRGGVGDYVSYLDARRNLIGAETTLALVERSVGEARLGVHRALGGAWVETENELEGPRRSEAVVPSNR